MRFKLWKESKKTRLENYQKTIRKKFIDGDDIDIRTSEFNKLNRKRLFHLVRKIDTNARSVFYEVIKDDDAYFIYVGFSSDGVQFNNFSLFIAEKLDEDVLVLFRESLVRELNNCDLVYDEAGMLEEMIKECDDFRFNVDLMPQEKIHYEKVETLDVKKLFDILKTYKNDTQGMIYTGREIMEDSTLLHIGFHNGGNLTVITITAKSLYWDVDAIFEKYMDINEVLIKADILAMAPSQYVVTLPWTNRPRGRNGVLI